MTGDVELRDKIATPASGPTVFALLDQYRPQIARVLPTGNGGLDRFVRIVRTELQREPKLHAADGHSFLGAVLTMASLNLEPGPALGQAWLLPFRNNRARRTDVQLIIGYRGYTLLAVRSGLVRAVDSEVIFARDRFIFEKGTSQRLEHTWPMDADRGELTGAWAMAVMRDGDERRFEVLSKSDIDRRRSRSRSRDDGPWVTDYPQMARKSAVRALVTQLPLSVEIAAAERADESVRRDFDLPLDEYAAVGVDETPALPDEPDAEATDAEPPPAAEPKPKDKPTATKPHATEEGAPS
jgi:recombination protein RecT